MSPNEHPITPPSLKKEALEELRQFPIDPEGGITFSALDKIRRALESQPEPQGPTESDLSELFYRHVGEGSEVGFENAIAEALARWGRPTIEPVPVSERLPGPEDVEPKLRYCWWYNYIDQAWHYCDAGHCDRNTWTHWLPHYALPVPQQQEVE
jgi:hypothetical protein